jgi:hypothetical protein
VKRKNIFIGRIVMFVVVVGLAFCFALENVSARGMVMDWYIKDFDSTIVINRDSSLDITERITADCGNLAGKHGIFRILPEKITLTTGEKIENPIKLVSITDFNGKSIKYSESRNWSDDTVTWKIGDPDRTVQGVNYYLIKYHVKNAIRFGNPNFDELYWNLNGNFWDIETDRFHASVVFPEGVTKDNSDVEYYTGSLGEKRKDLATFEWSAPNILEFDSLGTLGMRQGITASVTFPKNILIPYVPGFFEVYGKYLFLIIPTLVFVFCFRYWKRYGKDPEMDKAIIAEYDAPGKLTPIEIGMLMKNGGFRNELITAEIISLATRKLITIKELDKKLLFFHSKDYEFTRSRDTEAEKTLNAAERKILEKLFERGDVIELSSLKNSFHKSISEIKNCGKNLLVEKDLVTNRGMKLQIIFSVTGFIVLFLAFFLFGFSPYLALSLVISAIIILVFGFSMPKRTPRGAELNWEIKGFKLFMETVDKDRARFYEKENIFEKFLPYAIVFGITDLWIKRIKEIYGEEYFRNYAPAWYVGSLGAFDANSFSSAIDGLSSSIAANTSAPSGSGGAGGAGGGGGGGGGGGW